MRRPKLMGSAELREAETMPDPKPGRPAIASAEEDPNVTPLDAASPPCFMHEVEPAYAGYLDRSEVLDLLNTLLAGERAGAAVAREMGEQESDAEARAALSAIRKDEGRFCVMLARQIERLGGTPTAAVGEFRDKVMRLPTARERLALLNKGQAWVVRRLNEALPRIGDDTLHAALRDMLETHERNLGRGESLLR